MCLLLILPEVSEAGWRKLGVAHRVLDILVPEVVLQGPRVVAIIGELKTTGMAQHVWVDWERHLGSLADALDEAVETYGAHWPPALGNEDVSLFRVLTAQLAQRPHLVTANWMYAGDTVLDPVNVRITRSAAIAGRRPPRLADRGNRRQGSWSRRDARSGHACVRSPSTARPRAR